MTDQARTTARRRAVADAGALSAFRQLDHDRQRLVLLVADALDEATREQELSEVEVSNVVSRIVEFGVLQQRKAATARRGLERSFAPSLADVDLVPHATVEQARRLAALKTELLRRGAYSTSALAKERGMRRDAARQWIARARNQHRIFTVTHEGETLVPAFLLDASLEPRARLQPAIAALRGAGEDGWSLWTWFQSPSPWLDGDVPVEIADEHPERVADAARRRAQSAE